MKGLFLSAVALAALTMTACSNDGGGSSGGVEDIDVGKIVAESIAENPDLLKVDIPDVKIDPIVVPDLNVDLEPIDIGPAPRFEMPDIAL